ncbi:uncharacterized protein BYT42DRAFT_111852 [Radiomyces spectabilis]|uniref:uncharacterized protein n=1 Tax=Radiomyces spectabilis TaxID=64574 RepID=UPI00221F6CB4|nr:uncharacterized protein BYT42DRAFT_111852 [Radiomyces spectabilis]KAI8369480.1 hypothetical protein BYT42DRAFT_111852 [Radiomyces spectabilis]
MSSPELYEPELSELSDEATAPMEPAPMPRIKLKLRLNPSAAPTATAVTREADEQVPAPKRKKSKKKKSHHKKHKRRSHADTEDDLDVHDALTHRRFDRRESEVNIEDEGDDMAAQPVTNTQAHIPIGGKRPFAMLQAERQQENADSEYSSRVNNKGARQAESVEPSEVDEREYDDGFQYVHKDDTPRHYHRRSEEPAAKSTKGKKRGRPSKTKAPVVTPPPPRPTLPEPSRKDFKAACIKLLETLIKRDAYGFFLEPVDTNIVTDYLSVIKRPMDFSTMRRKVESDVYRSFDDFRRDFMLIVTNAKTYNAPNTIYWKSADKLSNFGLRSIERAAKAATTPTPQPNELERYKLSKRHSSPYVAPPLTSARDTAVKVEEEVDILGLEPTVAPQKRASQSEVDVASTRHTSVDINSRPMTPIRALSSKKKKKKVTEAGAIYAPDGSLNAVGGVDDLNTLIPKEHPFADRPQLTTVNPQALPSAFFLNRISSTTFDDWASNKHLIHSAHFCDYGPFTTLGAQTPGVFYTAQDASYIYPLYGDDRGEAYMKSLWDFADDLDLEGSMDKISVYLTRGAWDVAKEVVKEKPASSVKTEFGETDVASIVDRYKQANPTTATMATPATMPTTTTTA